MNIKTSMSNIASLENILQQTHKNYFIPTGSPPVVLSRPL